MTLELLIYRKEVFRLIDRAIDSFIEKTMNTFIEIDQHIHIDYS